jgi:hypothetical protein
LPGQVAPQQQQQQFPNQPDSSLASAIKQQAEQTTAALKAIADANTPKPPSYQDQLTEWQKEQKEKMTAARQQYQELSSKGEYDKALDTILAVVNTPPPQPQPGTTGSPTDPILKGMQSEALSRAKEKDPYLHQTYGAEIEAELQRLPLEERITSAGVARAEEVIRGRHMTELFNYQQHQQQIHQYQQQQMQAAAQPPPTSLPRPDLGEQPGQQLYGLPPGAREAAHILGVPLQTYAQYYQTFNDPTRPLPTDATLAGVEGIPLAPEPTLQEVTPFQQMQQQGIPAQYPQMAAQNPYQQQVPMQYQQPMQQVPQYPYPAQMPVAMG